MFGFEVFIFLVGVPLLDLFGSDEDLGLDATATDDGAVAADAVDLGVDAFFSDAGALLDLLADVFL